MPTVPEVAARVASNVGKPADDAGVLEATSAAWEFACITAGRIGLGDAVPDVDESSLITQGLIGFSRSIYLDQLASRGTQVALGDNVIDTIYSPEDLYRHWRHYFAPMAVAWGFA